MGNNVDMILVRLRCFYEHYYGLFEIFIKTVLTIAPSVPKAFSR